MSAFLNVCRFAPTAGGTSDWTYSTAITGYQSPSASGVVSGQSYKYRAESADLSQWEIGEGTYNTSTQVLTRATVLYNSSGTGTGTGQSGAGSKINFSTVPQVAIVAIKEDLISVQDANAFTSAQKDQARVNIGVPSRNYIINPDGQVNQLPAGSQADGTYDFDQWYVLTQSNPITSSQLTAVQNGTPFMMRMLQAAASSQRFGRIQWIENQLCSELRGSPVSISALIRASGAIRIRYAVVEWQGTADAITKDVVNDWTSTNYTTGNFFTSTSTAIVGTGYIDISANALTQLSVPNLGTVSGSMNNIALFFWTDATQAQNATFDVANAQLIKGTQVPPYQIDPNSLNQCFRYVQFLYGVLVSGYQTTGSVVYTGFAISPMRVAPNATISLISNSNMSTMVANLLQPTYVIFQGTITATGGGYSQCSIYLKAQL